MNDDFIYRALPKARKEFAESLYAKISTRTPGISRVGMDSRIRSRRRLQAAVILLSLLLLVAWSQIKLLIRYVPIGDLWLVEFNQTTQTIPDDQSVALFVPTPLPTPRFFDPTLMSTAEIEEFIQEVGVFALYYPSWIPEGFQAITPPREMTSWESTIGMWSNNAKEEIRLFIAPIAGGMRPYALPGMWKEVSVNGEPAVLIYGRFAPTSYENPRAQREWDDTLGLQLHWVMEKNVYTLETFSSYVSEQDLIRMAESMEVLPPPWVTVTP